ncbi:hypothetical protein HK102_013033, partial [Quaeritorhiza haematococci]
MSRAGMVAEEEWADEDGDEEDVVDGSASASASASVGGGDVDGDGEEQEEEERSVERSSSEKPNESTESDAYETTSPVTTENAIPSHNFWIHRRLGRSATVLGGRDSASVGAAAGGSSSQIRSWKRRSGAWASGSPSTGLSRSASLNVSSAVSEEKNETETEVVRTLMRSNTQALHPTTSLRSLRTMRSFKTMSVTYLDAMSRYRQIRKLLREMHLETTNKTGAGKEASAITRTKGDETPPHAQHAHALVARTLTPPDSPSTASAYTYMQKGLVVSSDGDGGVVGMLAENLRELYWDVVTDRIDFEELVRKYVDGNEEGGGGGDAEE